MTYYAHPTQRPKPYKHSGPASFKVFELEPRDSFLRAKKMLSPMDINRIYARSLTDIESALRRIPSQNGRYYKQDVALLAEELGWSLYPRGGRRSVRYRGDYRTYAELAGLVLFDDLMQEVFGDSLSDLDYNRFRARLQAGDFADLELDILIDRSPRTWVLDPTKAASLKARLIADENARQAALDQTEATAREAARVRIDAYRATLPQDEQGDVQSILDRLARLEAAKSGD